MIQRRLGKSQLEVSALGLGCWAIGGPWTFVDHPAGWGKVEDAESFRALEVALDSGINIYDTAANQLETLGDLKKYQGRLSLK